MTIHFDLTEVVWASVCIVLILSIGQCTIKTAETPPMSDYESCLSYCPTTFCKTSNILLA